MVYDELARRRAERPAPSPLEERPPTVEAALRRFGPLTAPEVAAVCSLPARAPAELWALAAEWRARDDRGLFAPP